MSAGQRSAPSRLKVNLAVDFSEALGGGYKPGIAVASDRGAKGTRLATSSIRIG